METRLKSYIAEFSLIACFAISHIANAKWLRAQQLGYEAAELLYDWYKKKYGQLPT